MAAQAGKGGPGPRQSVGAPIQAESVAEGSADGPGVSSPRHAKRGADPPRRRSAANAWKIIPWPARASRTLPGTAREGLFLRVTPRRAMRRGFERVDGSGTGQSRGAAGPSASGAAEPLTGQPFLESLRPASSAKATGAAAAGIRIGRVHCSASRHSDAPVRHPWCRRRRRRLDTSGADCRPAHDRSSRPHRARISGDSHPEESCSNHASNRGRRCR